VNRCVILRIGEGSFETGFPVTCQFALEFQPSTTEQIGRLPANPDLLKLYQDWRSQYLQLGNPVRLDPEPDQITNISFIQDCVEASERLGYALNQWLDSPDFRPIHNKLLEQLKPEHTIRILMLTDQVQLQKLPWHLWTLLERYPKAEMGFSSPMYEAPSVPQPRSDGVKILAVLGDGTDLDTQAEQHLLKGLPRATVKVLVEPSRSDFQAHLWNEPWDILFFAGHSNSSSTGNSGQLWLNATTPLAISEFKYALRRALDNGLQLAIFNSCDGLGLAKALSDLNMPQVIVMREPVPDVVARAFLQHFLGAFAQGQHFHLAVREARERLQGIESEFPCATWLPVIIQNPAAVPPTWNSLGGEPVAAAIGNAPSQDGAMVTMVWTDLLDSTAMKRDLQGQYIRDRDQTYLSQILHPHRTRVESSLSQFRGRIIKTEGDAFFLAFPTVTTALEWAIHLQRDHTKQPIQTPLGPLQVRIGIHTGNPAQNNDDYIGQEVDYLVRIADLAQGSQILLSEVTAVLIRNSGIRDLEIYSHGQYLLKSIGQVPIFEALWDQHPPQKPRLDVKALFNQGFLKPALPRIDDASPAAPSVFPLVSLPLSPQIRQRKTVQKSVLWVLCASLGWSLALSGVRWVGGLQALELWSFDQLMRLRPYEKPDNRILVITVTAQDLLAQSADSRRSSLSDQNLLKLLQKIEPFEPRAIGLDIYRDFTVQPQFPELAQRLRQDPKIIAVCKSRDVEGDLEGVSPPVEVPSSRIGFSDFIEDGDGIIRRQLLFMTPDPLSPCQAHYAFGTQLAMRYLAHQGIQPSFTPDGNLILGHTTFRRLQPLRGGYQFHAEGGHQMMLNFRALPRPQDIALQVSLSDVLNNKVAPDLIKDRVILIGVSANSSSDFWSTPYGAGGVRKVSGVMIQANMISHLLSAVLNQRPMIWVWPVWGDSLWLWAWGSVGGFIVLWMPRLFKGLTGLCLASVVLLAISLGVLIQGCWLTLAPTIIVLMLTGGTVGAQNRSSKPQKLRKAQD
jgi:CHASE2 domain-containing sensor protein/class 3 adenylate cyclase